jgi:DNA (cytosine-5)-methyltransferase 1
MIQRYTAIDLFAGCGGFSLGLRNAGFDILLAVDKWDRAVSSYRRNFSHPALACDIKEITRKKLISEISTKKIDVIVGGPPCQGFSIQRIGEDHDPRNSLVFEFSRIVREMRPKIFAMENVTGLLGVRGRVIFDQLVSDLEKDGYSVDFQVLNAADFGVPQIRKRVFVVGWLKGSVSDFQFPVGCQADSGYVTVRQAFQGLLPPPRQGVEGVDPLHYETRMSPLNRQRISIIPPGGGFESLPEELRVSCHKPGAAKIGHRGVYGRLHPDAPAGTITARFDSFTRGRFGHPWQHRNITLREGARLQSFPDDFQFCGNQEEIAAQIGNAVPPGLATALATKLMEALNRTSQSSRQ